MFLYIYIYMSIRHKFHNLKTAKLENLIEDINIFSTISNVILNTHIRLLKST